LKNGFGKFFLLPFSQFNSNFIQKKLSALFSLFPDPEKALEFSLLKKTLTEKNSIKSAGSRISKVKAKKCQLRFIGFSFFKKFKSGNLQAFQ